MDGWHKLMEALKETTKGTAEMAQTATGTDTVPAKKTIVPRIMIKKFSDGDEMKLSTPNCRECPFNHATYCTESGGHHEFRMADIGEMKLRGFPKCCPLKEAEVKEEKK